MRKVWFIRFFTTLIVVAGLVFACKSAPKEAPQPEQEVVEEIVEVTPEEPEEIVEMDSAIPETTPIAVDSDIERQQERHAELGNILAEADAKRQEIMDDGLYEGNLQAFDIADNALKRATEAYDAGIEAVDENALVDGRFARDGFTAIIESAWLARTDALRVKSAYAQQQALKLKADIAVKDKYNFGTELYNKGNAALREKDYHAAIDFYEKSMPQFNDAIKIATEKRVKAELALKSAEQKIAESEKIVDDAVKFIENSSNEKGEIL
ncbi:MAG: hypothetical protein LBC27_08745 [Spirochaetaceae bacterium]|nr:hypothetical protein [Spirochaetaceae bacterium]